MEKKERTFYRIQTTQQFLTPLSSKSGFYRASVHPYDTSLRIFRPGPWSRCYQDIASMDHYDVIEDFVMNLSGSHESPQLFGESAKLFAFTQKGFRAICDGEIGKVLKEQLSRCIEIGFFELLKFSLAEGEFRCLDTVQAVFHGGGMDSVFSSGVRKVRRLLPTTVLSRF